MGSLTVATAQLARGELQGRDVAKRIVGASKLTARIALDEETKRDAYGIRHASYSGGGFIDAMEDGLFSDADDLKPNAQVLVVYRDQRPVASVRLCTLNTDPAAGPGWDEIPAARIFPEAVSQLSETLTQERGRPARLTEINRLVRHPDFAKDYELVFILFRFVSVLVYNGSSDMMLSCVRRNHSPFYKRLHFSYSDGPRRYAGVKFETNLMSCHYSKFETVQQDMPFVDTRTSGLATYKALNRGELISVAQAA